MKREIIETSVEQDLITGLITSDSFCQQILPVLNIKLLKTDYAKIIATWCKNYYYDFGVPPQRNMARLFRDNQEEIKDESVRDNVLTFLTNLDKNYDDKLFNNVDYVAEKTIKYLKRLSVEDLADRLKDKATLDEVESAESLITSYRCVERHGSKAISLLDDTEEIVNAIKEEEVCLFDVPDAYGSVLGKIHREDFIGILAPMKRGKTFFLMDLGIRAMRQGLKVIFVSLEMSEGDVKRRFWTCASSQPRETVQCEVPFFEGNDTSGYTLKYRTINKKGALSSSVDIKKEQQTLKQMCRGGAIRILVGQAFTWTVNDIETEIDKLEEEQGYIPDVIIVDYADILGQTGKGEYRQELDVIWKRLRGLAQKRKCAVFTASQTTRDGIVSDLTQNAVAEDIRKLAHVTCMIGLNQTDYEKERNLMRINQLVVREGRHESRFALCTQCYSIGKPVIESRFVDEVIGYKKTEDESPRSERSEKIQRKIKML